VGSREDNSFCACSGHLLLNTMYDRLARARASGLESPMALLTPSPMALMEFSVLSFSRSGVFSSIVHMYSVQRALMDGCLSLTPSTMTEIHDVE
jgi:hypothetical protein